MNNLVSVIIPAYNHENYIQETIKSIINQTYKNIELIIIDDGSKDNTWQKIKETEEECKARFVNIHFETKENEGTCKTLNKLISLTNGEFIYLIASDDMAKPIAIEKEVDFLTKNQDYVLVVGNNEFIDKNSKSVGRNKDGNIVDIKNADFKTFGDSLKDGRKDVDFNSDQFGSYSSLVKANYIPNGYLVRKSAIMDKVYPFTPEAPLEDFYMMLQLSKVGKFKYIDDILFSYRIHNTNTSKNIQHMENMTKQTLLYEEKIVNRIGNENWKKIFYLVQIVRKVKLNLGFIKVYRRKDFLRKEKNYILKIFNKEFIISKKK